jgi:hypothetical protein
MLIMQHAINKIRFGLPLLKRFMMNERANYVPFSPQENYTDRAAATCL